MRTMESLPIVRRLCSALGRAAVVLMVFANVPQAAAAAPDNARLAALARDVDRVESVRNVKRIMLSWANYVDQGQWERAAALFADDALLQHGDDQFHGRADILAYFRRVIGKGTDGLPASTIHTPYLFTPIVTLSADGNTAKARWHALSMRGTLGGDASWQGGIFECVYVRRNGGWKIASHVFTPQLLGPYETGWSSWKKEIPLVPYHFEPTDIGKSAALGPGVTATGPAKASLAALGGRIQALRDEEQVRNLQNAYGYYVDFKMWDDVTDLFAPASSVEVAGVGSYKGSKGVRRNLEREGGAINLRYGEMYDHIQADMVVEVAADGFHARGRGIEIGMVGNNDGPAYWIITRFDNLYVKQGGKWRFDKMRLARAVKTDYFQGWGKSWIATEPASAAFRPDGPASAELPPLWQLERPAPVARPLPATTLAKAETGVFAAGGFDAIENLAGGYGQYLDDNHWEELGSLFAAQGERDSAGGGFIRTPARIASFSRKRYGAYNEHRTFANMHIRTQPVIDISPDGMKGQDRTRLFQIAIGPANAITGRSGAMFVSGMYEDDLIFEDGVWKMKRADIDHLIYMPYKTGWTGIKEGVGARSSPSLGAVAGEKFDAMNTGDVNAAYPKLPHMWFHYRNPVSGRVPPYLMPKYILPEP